MALILLTLNLAACAVVWAVAMYFYLSHDRPECARQHYKQIALVLIAVGAFAAGATALRGAATPWWEIALRVGLAMVAARTLRDARRDRRRSPRA